MSGGIVLPENVAAQRQQEQQQVNAEQLAKIKIATYLIERRGTIATQLFLEIGKLEYAKVPEALITEQLADENQAGALQCFRDAFGPAARACVDAADILMAELGIVKTPAVLRELAAQAAPGYDTSEASV